MCRACPNPYRRESVRSLRQERSHGSQRNHRRSRIVIGHWLKDFRGTAFARDLTGRRSRRWYRLGRRDPFSGSIDQFVRTRVRGDLMRGLLFVLAWLMMMFGSWALAETRPLNPQSGGTIYQQHCLRCHGQAGDGLGSDARSLIVPPENLQSPRSRSKTDRELMLGISQGVLFSPMHGWRDRLSEQEMRDVLSYIRTFAPFLPVT